MAVATFETDIRKEQHDREKDWKDTKRQTKSDLKDVNMACAAVETEIRKEQHEREKNWKDTKRNTKEELKAVNMAAAIFSSIADCCLGKPIQSSFSPTETDYISRSESLVNQPYPMWADL